MTVLVLFVVILCLVIAAWSWMTYYPDAPPDLPGALPIIGHSLKVFGDRIHLLNFVREIQVFSLAKGGVAQLRFVTHTVYVITDPEDGQTVANTCLTKPYFYDFAKEFVKNGLLTSEASIWKSHRKLLNPAFNPQVLNTYVNEMNKQARNLVSQLASKVGKGPSDVRNFFINYTLSTVTRTSLGLDTKEQSIIDTDYAEAVHDLFEIYCARTQKAWLHLSYLFNMSAMKRKQTVLLKKLRNITDPVIRKKKSELIQTNWDPSTYGNTTQEKFRPVLDRMLHLTREHNVFSDKDIREHLDTLVAAAYDTTSASIEIILLIVGSNTDMQDRIYNEIQEVLEHKDDDITKQDLPKLVYLEAVIKESLRMYTVSPIIARKVDKDVKLKNYTLRAGSTAVLGLYGLLRHPMWGADAEQFRPERWLNPATLPEHPGLYSTFGVGKRNCIGKQYAMMTMKMALAHILRQYRVKCDDFNNVVFEYDIVVKPVSTHLISLTLRT